MKKNNPADMKTQKHKEIQNSLVSWCPGALAAKRKERKIW